jgi:hypothetical protein
MLAKDQAGGAKENRDNNIIAIAILGAVQSVITDTRDSLLGLSSDSSRRDCDRSLVFLGSGLRVSLILGLGVLIVRAFGLRIRLLVFTSRLSFLLLSSSGFVVLRLLSRQWYLIGRLF